MKSLIKKIKEFFSKRQQSRQAGKFEVPPMPSWEEIVKIMYDKNLAFGEEIVKVIYSQDKTNRFVVLKSEKGFYTYCFETIFPFDEEEWKYVSQDKDALPAQWETPAVAASYSLFETEEIAMRELLCTPEYKKFFI